VTNRISEVNGSLQPTVALDCMGTLHVAYRSADSHWYAYRHAQSGKWVNSALPTGPYGEEEAYGNITVVAWNEVHIIRTLSISGTGVGVCQYLSRDLPFRFMP
jgi:hypothetical protein